MTAGVEPYRGGVNLDLVRQHLAPAATDAELEYFGRVCQRLSLDPFAEQIAFVGRRRKVTEERGGRQVEAWRMVHTPQVTVAGRRAIANRTGRLRGIEGPVWCAARGPAAQGAPRGPLVWLDVWDDDERPPYAARCLVYAEGWQTPANGTAKWVEFAQYIDPERRRLSPFWDKAPSHMLGKVAESLALRRAFPEVDTVVTQLDNAVPGLEGDDGAVVAEAEAELPMANRAPEGDEPDYPPGYEPF